MSLFTQIAAVGKGAGKELVKKFPGVDLAFGGYEEWQKNQQESQHRKFVEDVKARLSEIHDADWYHTEQGQKFTNKILASARNIEYGDKIEYFVSAFVNGPKLGSDPCLPKFVEMIRQLSKASLDVLAMLARNAQQYRNWDRQEVSPGGVAKQMGWNDAHLALACVKELESNGVLVDIIEFHDEEGIMRPSHQTGGKPTVTKFTIKFANFLLAQNR